MRGVFAGGRFHPYNRIVASCSNQKEVRDFVLFYYR